MCRCPMAGRRRMGRAHVVVAPAFAPAGWIAGNRDPGKFAKVLRGRRTSRPFRPPIRRRVAWEGFDWPECQPRGSGGLDGVHCLVEEIAERPYLVSGEPGRPGGE